MDFFTIRTSPIATGPFKGELETRPEFQVRPSQDLMIRGGDFYAIWDEDKGLWSTDEYDVQRLVDEQLRQVAEEDPEIKHVRYLRTFSNGMWQRFQAFLSAMSDRFFQLDTHLTFADDVVTREDHVSKRLKYSLEEGFPEAYDELMSVLYEPEEREKLEWAIGSILAGDSVRIQKFIVLYGPPGTGKSTVLNLVGKLFEGYAVPFEASSLVGNGQFGLEAFRSNPLVAIQQDGDLSKIESNSRLNSIISHEEMLVNEKFKSTYASQFRTFLFLGTNQPVQITDAKSGILRRLIDVHPSGRLVSEVRYRALLAQMEFELGKIASHCLAVYRELGQDYYSRYRPIKMLRQTNDFHNFLEHHALEIKSRGGIQLREAYDLYKAFCERDGRRHLPSRMFRAEMDEYFEKFYLKYQVDGVEVGSYFEGLKMEKFESTQGSKPEPPAPSLVLDHTESLLDTMCANDPAQYASPAETPQRRWAEVETTLVDIDTRELHYVKPPVEHIVIDFDLKDDDGNKSLEKNLEAASMWPATYAELSKGGQGIHLHYIYEGNPHELKRIYSEGIEVKVFVGNSSLRRRLTKCNNVPVATIVNHLPRKETRVLDQKTMTSERSIRNLIERNLRKEIHAGTKPSIDFIHTILDEAYESGMIYDVTDLRPKILRFATDSTNHSLYCMKLVSKMQFKSQERERVAPEPREKAPLVFFDVEVFPNLFVVCWKTEGSDHVVRMINPKAEDVEQMFKQKLVGFNNRKYDNHILYAASMGYTLEGLYKLSQKIINNEPGACFGEAYDLSYTDIYDFSSKKQGLKKFQIELGILHSELGLPWDEPVPQELWDKVAEYCENDVRSTEAVFRDRYQDFVARQILSDLSGLNPNSSTQQHTARIVFGKDRDYKTEFKYTDLSRMFPGYTYEAGKSSYRGLDPSEGGYVDSEPGMYENVAVLDVASMHPASIKALNLFGKYTKNFNDLVEARVLIKHEDFEGAKKVLNGALAPYLGDPKQAKALSYALKIVINIVYGLTSAHFDNPFRDVRNKDNIVAKRGALFMIDLQFAVQEQGFQVVHIKTDSIKIPNATPDIIRFVTEFGKMYGYDFEHETTYEKFCLVNDAVYIARKPDGTWDAVGAQFAEPYVYKTLFSHEPIDFSDLCLTKTVTKGAIYIDPTNEEAPMALSKSLRFVGRAGAFCPMKPGCGGGALYRVADDADGNKKLYAVAGTKGYQWLEADVVRGLDRMEDVDLSYFDKLVESAVDNIGRFGDFAEFVK